MLAGDLLLALIADERVAEVGVPASRGGAVVIACTPAEGFGIGARCERDDDRRGRCTGAQWGEQRLGIDELG
jgi:hypothetical protein